MSLTHISPIGLCSAGARHEPRRTIVLYLELFLKPKFQKVPIQTARSSPDVRRAVAAPAPQGAIRRVRQSIHRFAMDISNENDQANRAISTGKLHALPHFHTRPINVVVFHGSQGNTRFQVGFPLRCLQRLSRPYIATLLCGWRHNRSTRDTSIPVLSY